MVKLLPKFKALNNQKRYTNVFGGRGSAKSFHVACFLLILTYTKGETILYTRYTMTAATKSIIPEFQEKMELMEVAKVFDVSGNIITNKITGSKIIFSGIKSQSGNQTAKLKSIAGLTVWVLDEAEEMHDKREFDRIDDSIRKLEGSNKVFLIYNTDQVDTQHWIYKHFHQSGKRDDTEYILSTYLDNINNLHPSFIDKANAAKREDLEFYNVNYLGHFPIIRDSVFPDGYKTYVNDPAEYDRVLTGGDFGFADNPTTAIKVFFCGPALYLRETLYGHGMTSKMIKDGLEDDQVKDPSIWDSAVPQLIQELRQIGVNAYPAQKGPGSVIAGIKKLWKYQIFIHAGSENLQKEMNRYRWKKMSNGEYFRDSKGNRVPVKEDDHCIDAVRYVVNMFG